MKILTQTEWKRLPKNTRLRSETNRLYVLEHVHDERVVRRASPQAKEDAW